MHAGQQKQADGRILTKQPTPKVWDVPSYWLRTAVAPTAAAEFPPPPVSHEWRSEESGTAASPTVSGWSFTDLRTGLQALGVPGELRYSGCGSA